jgi:protein involved in polysaccharide export with SLBB domain
LSPHARGDILSLRRSNGPPESIGLAAASDLVLRRGDQISISTVDRPVFVSVVGNVARPGLAAFADGTRFATLFQEVGGLGADRSPMVVIVTRTIAGQRSTRRFSLEQALAMGPTELKLGAHDLIVVARADGR